MQDAAEGLTRAAADSESVLGADSPLVAALHTEAAALQGFRRGYGRDGSRFAGMTPGAAG